MTMKMCDKHWEVIKEETKKNGLWHRVAKDTNELAERSEKFRKGEIPEKEAFEPLIQVCMMIYREAAHIGGPYLMDQKEDGTDYCPICEAMEHSQGKSDDDGHIYTKEEIEKIWTVDACTAVKEQAKELGVLYDA